MDCDSCTATGNNVSDCETGIWPFDGGSNFEIIDNLVYDTNCTAIRIDAPSYVSGNEVYQAENGIYVLTRIRSVLLEFPYIIGAWR